MFVSALDQVRFLYPLPLHLPHLKLSYQLLPPADNHSNRHPDDRFLPRHSLWLRLDRRLLPVGGCGCWSYMDEILGYMGQETHPVGFNCDVLL